MNKTKIIKFMKNTLANDAAHFLDCDEVDYTKLAEYAASEFEIWNELDDPNSDIWDYAVDAAMWYESNH